MARFALGQKNHWRDILTREWLLLVSLAGWVGTSLYVGHRPTYTVREWQVLYILFLLFLITTGLKHAGAFTYVARRLERGHHVAWKLTLFTIFLAMWVTNDVALLIVVPLTMNMRLPHKARLVTLEALAANVGAALTPFGTPQNLFIYWFYQIPPAAFLQTIAPFVGTFTLALGFVAWYLKLPSPTVEEEDLPRWTRRATVHLLWLGILVLMILHQLPLYVGLLPLAYVALFDRSSLQVDYALLVTFFCFFGMTDNLSQVMGGWLGTSKHVFLEAVLLSQVLSNVPATLLLVHHVSDWAALLWGVNVGGFGSLIGSLANVIAYRIYTSEEKGGRREFLMTFSAFSYAALGAGILLYLGMRYGL
ncbi:MAG: hypothetical protein GXO55_08490 [Chloroflexi bacterium]|nr:hypothetical protein [Chloroflexota bacterium]